MQVVVLSPHRDDAAFSCGLLQHALLRAGCQVRIVTLCTVSSYAPYLSVSHEDRIRQVTRVRCDEDLRFVEILCDRVDGSLELIDLGWQDLPLRWQTQDDAALAPSPLRTAEVDALRDTLSALSAADIVLAPRAIGGHIDHRLVNRAARLAIPLSALVLYDDLPYAAAGTDSRELVEDVMTEAWLPVGGAASGLKRKLCLCYPSQIAASLADVMEQHGQLHGGERFHALPETLRFLQDALHAAPV